MALTFDHFDRGFAASSALPVSALNPLAPPAIVHSVDGWERTSRPSSVVAQGYFCVLAEQIDTHWLGILTRHGMQVCVTSSRTV